MPTSGPPMRESSSYLLPRPLSLTTRSAGRRPLRLRWWHWRGCWGCTCCSAMGSSDTQGSGARNGAVARHSRRVVATAAAAPRPARHSRQRLCELRAALGGPRQRALQGVKGQLHARGALVAASIPQRLCHDLHQARRGHWQAGGVCHAPGNEAAAPAPHAARTRCGAAAFAAPARRRAPCRPPAWSLDRAGQASSI